MNEMFFVSSHSEKVKYKGYSFLDDTILKGGLKGGWGGPDNILGFKKGKNTQNEWNDFCFQPLWKMKYKENSNPNLFWKGV